ncbi:hypothetical protein [Anaeromyxobacter oryzae]|uniref:Secreted protein n=1 Tax=Anaeromyxobacter oryzae TaxID=2918170 RepID=A0ABN6MQE4_9BACT|nr:hypothetical protein [Anaeromyxobacter oryzae]BDG03231.1 hypothetical protein AMOR_22270 [Anaeromyxobacter oryzae]
MVRRLPLLTTVAALAAALAPGTAAAGPPSDGTIETDGARIEILGKPVRVGETVELPEGFIRVEEAGTEDEHVGSFSVVPAASLRATANARAALPPGTPAVAAAAEGYPPRAAGAPEPACLGERNAYLRELWKQSGIDVKDVDAIIQGLEGTGYGPGTGFYWFAIATDPFRPLAWSSDLRDRADALARCVREHAATRVAPVAAR